MDVRSPENPLEDPRDGRFRDCFGSYVLRELPKYFNMQLKRASRIYKMACTVPKFLPSNDESTDDYYVSVPPHIKPFLPIYDNIMKEYNLFARCIPGTTMAVMYFFGVVIPEKYPQVLDIVSNLRNLANTLSIEMDDSYIGNSSIIDLFIGNIMKKIIENTEYNPEFDGISMQWEQNIRECVFVMQSIRNQTLFGKTIQENIQKTMPRRVRTTFLEDQHWMWNPKYWIRYTMFWYKRFLCNPSRWFVRRELYLQALDDTYYTTAQNDQWSGKKDIEGSFHIRRTKRVSTNIPFHDIFYSIISFLRSEDGVPLKMTPDLLQQFAHHIVQNCRRIHGHNVGGKLPPMHVRSIVRLYKQIKAKQHIRPDVESVVYGHDTSWSKFRKVHLIEGEGERDGESGGESGGESEGERERTRGRDSWSTVFQEYHDKEKYPIVSRDIISRLVPLLDFAHMIRDLSTSEFPRPIITSLLESLNSKPSRGRELLEIVLSESAYSVYRANEQNPDFIMDHFCTAILEAKIADILHVIPILRPLTLGVATPLLANMGKILAEHYPSRHFWDRQEYLLNGLEHVYSKDQCAQLLHDIFYENGIPFFVTIGSGQWRNITSLVDFLPMLFTCRFGFE
jgi:hypothetical protein